MNCSREEIERKRLAALQKRQSKLNNSGSPLKPFNATPKSSSYSPSPSTSSSYNDRNKAGPTKTYNNSPKPFHPYGKPECTLKNESSIPVDKVVSGTIYLISEDRFEVKPSEFCTPLINIFKTLPSKSYDPKTKLWNFAMDDYQQLISKVAPLAPHIVLGTIPDYVLSALKEPTMDSSNIDLSPIEATLRNKLMPFQQEGVRFGVARRGRCMLADDMGLGKTYQALALASYYRHDWPLLVVTTSSMRDTWQSKIRELLPSVPLLGTVALGDARAARAAAERQVVAVVSSYKMAVVHLDTLRAKGFGVIIVDECHYLKSSKAQCSRALHALARGAARLVLLSGTPALSRPAELHAQLALLRPAALPSYTDYGKRYCAGKPTAFGWDMSGQSHLAELQVLLHRRFLIRRTKAQAMPQLQLQTREAVFLDSSLVQLSSQDEQSRRLLASRGAAPAALLAFFSESARAKAPAVCAYIRQLVAPPCPPCPPGPAPAPPAVEKFLVFAHHKTMIDAVCATLDELGTRYVCIVGSTPAPARAELVDRFQFSPACRAAVLSVTAAGAGLSLTAAGLVLFAELHWNPGILAQAEARAHRMGQAGAVRVRFLLAAGTCDDHMWPLLQGKLDVLNEVGLSKDSLQNTAETYQESRSSITQYLSPLPKNQNDYIPGTNIRRGSLNSDTANTGHNSANTSSYNPNTSHNSAKTSSYNPNTGHNHVDTSTSGNTDDRQTVRPAEDISANAEEFEKSFLEDDEGDQWLAQLDL